MEFLFDKKSWKKTFFLFIPYLYKTSFARKKALLTMVIALSEIVFAAYLPFLMKKITIGFDKGGIVIAFVGLLGLFWLLEHLFFDLAKICFFPIVNEAIKDISYRCIERLHNTPNDYSGARLVAIIKRISMSARSFMKMFFLMVPRTVLKLFSAAVLLGRYHYYYALGVVLLFFLCFYVLQALITVYAGIRKKAWDCSDTVSSEIYDSMSAAEIAKFHGTFEMNRIDSILAEEAKLWNKVNIKFHMIGMSVSLVFGIFFIGSLVAAVLTGLSVGDFILIKGLLISLFIPLKSMGEEARSAVEAVVDMQKITNILAKPLISAKMIYGKLKVRELVFDNVNFAYKEKKMIFHKLSVKISAGDRVLLRGPSGAGKSTFCMLMSSLLQPSKGKIFLNGVDLRKYTAEELGKTMVFVPQRQHLFDASLIDNLTYGRSFFSRKMIYNALEKMDLTELLQNLANGLDSMIGERGKFLSGGERRKLALARVFLFKPTFLILDESTCFLDEVSERRILNNLFKEIPTICMVSHSSCQTDLFKRIFNFSLGSMTEEKTCNRQRLI